MVNENYQKNFTFTDFRRILNLDIQTEVDPSSEAVVGLKSSPLPTEGSDHNLDY